MLIDVNILIYAYDINFKYHTEIKNWFEEKLTSDEPIYLCWQSISGFLRITTNSRLFPIPMSGEKSRAKVNEWLERPNVSIMVQTAKHWSIFEKLLTETRIVGPKVMDAHLAALAMEHGVNLVTTDRDFAAFKGLKILNPLDL